MLDWAAAQAAVEAAADWASDGPGGAVLAFDTTGPRASAAAGVESLATLAPFGIDSVARCASVTKHVFAAFVLAQEAVGLDDPLGQHLPQLAPVTGAVTVGRALDMSGGIPDTRECLTLTGHSIFTQTFAPDLLDFHASLPRLNHPAGVQVHYSNGGYRLVEEALRAHGLLFDDFLRDEMRTPTGLPMRAAEMWTDPVPGLVTGYWRDGGVWREGVQGMHLSAAGSLTASGRALAEWGRRLLVSGSRLAALGASRHLLDGRATGYGLGMRRQRVGRRELVGHGGSQPGFKSYLLLDPATGTGVVLVANRDDVDSAGLAARVMAALLGETLPTPGSDLAPGLYVAPEGADWLAVGTASVARLDDEVAVYRVEGGGIDSQSPTSSLRLRMEGQAIAGTAGHAPARYVPAREAEIAPGLRGRWRHDSGAVLEVSGDAVVMGAGPKRQAMPLRALGGGRYLFTLTDGPWTRRICLHQTAPERLTLALSRARMIDYRAD